MITLSFFVTRKEKSMGNKKPTQHQVTFLDKKLTIAIHPNAEKAFVTWSNFRILKNRTSVREINPFYRPSIKLVKDDEKNIYYFFSTFNYVEYELLSGERLDQHCLIYPLDKFSIEALAWREVADLSYQRGINHFELLKALHTGIGDRPKLSLTVIGAKELNISTYCHFANIETHTFDYHRKQSHHLSLEKQKAIEQTSIPKNDSWLLE